MGKYVFFKIFFKKIFILIFLININELELRIVLVFFLKMCVMNYIVR